MRKRLEPGLNPKGTVVISYTVDDEEFERFYLEEDDDVEGIADRQGDMQAQGLIGTVRLFDGDSGQLLMEMRKDTDA